MKKLLIVLLVWFGLVSSVFAADGRWSGTVIGVETAKVVVGTVSGDPATASSVGSLFGFIPSVAGYFIGAVVHRDVTTEVTRLLVRIDEDGLETTFDLSHDETDHDRIGLGSRVDVARVYSGGFKVTLAD